MRHPTQTAHPTPRNHNRMRPPMSMVNTKRDGEVLEMLLSLLALVVLAGPTLPTPFAVDEGGGGAELLRGGRT